MINDRSYDRNLLLLRGQRDWTVGCISLTADRQEVRGVSCLMVKRTNLGENDRELWKNFSRNHLVSVAPFVFDCD